MTDKVQKIREEVERLKESGCASPIVICDTLLAFIDSLQEEPIKIKKGCKYLCLGDMFNNDTGKISFIGGKIYLAPEDDTLVSEENGWLCDTSEDASNFELVEEPVSIWHDKSEKPEREDLLIETNDGRIIHRQSINNYGMVKRWAYTSDLLNLDNSCNFGKNLPEEPVSNPTPNEKMSVERWKKACEAACCDRNYRSHYGLTETRDDYFVDGVQWADEHPKEEPVSNDLEEAASRYAKEEYNHKNPATLPDRCIGCYAPLIYAFKAGAMWQKEQMVRQSVDGKVIAKFPLASEPFYNDVEIYLYFTIGLSEGDKVKVIIIKEE